MLKKDMNNKLGLVIRLEEMRHFRRKFLKGLLMYRWPELISNLVGVTNANTCMLLDR